MRGLLCVVAVVWAGVAGAQESETPAVSKQAPKAELDVTKLVFSADSVKRVIRHHNDEIQGCYEEALAGRDKPFEGKVMTSFVVTPQGLVKGAKVLKKGTTLKDDKLHTCLVTTLSSFSFPVPSDKRDHPIEYPFNLKAVH